MSKGIDVSNNNGHVDWAGVANSGYTFAQCKATEGLTFVDKFYDDNRRGAESHGLHFGGYHFFTPGEDVSAQVAFFLDHAKPRQGEIVPALDYERMPATRVPAEEFVSVLHRQLGHWPMFYSYLSFVHEMKIPAASPLANCPLWLADFTAVRPAPPSPWHEITIWQQSSSGRVPGIGGPVDLDVGKPPIDAPTSVITGYEVHYRDKHGDRQTRKTQTPGLWLVRHPNPKKHGRVTIYPVHKKV